MTQISKIIEAEQQELVLLKEKTNRKRIRLILSAKDFKELFLIQANKIILSRNINREFEITEQNSDIINQIYFYCVGSEKMFRGELEKGILLVGKNGVGKVRFQN